MYRTLREAAVIAILFTASAGAQAQDVDVRVGSDTKSQPTRNLTQLNDFHLAAWVILESRTSADVSKWAEQHAQSDQIREFAAEVSSSHRELISSLRKALGRPIAAAVEGEAKATDANPDIEFGEVLQEIATRLEATQQQDSAGRRRLGFRGDSADTPAGSDEPKNRDERAATDQPQRRIDPGDRRERLRAALPAIREKLPEILEVVGETIEETDTEKASLAFIELKRQLSDQYATSIEKELQNSPKGDFDQAFLGFSIAAHTRLIDTMEVAEAHGSAELSSILKDHAAKLKTQLTETRKLMHEAPASRGKQSP